jgi:sigma-B regulation protein RsbU (phosphoserine phosphatase)
MIDINNLTDAENIFIKEFKSYNNTLEVIDNLNKFEDLNKLEILKSELNLMTEQYLNLLHQAVKLVKISDSTQLKLRNVQQQLKQQNLKIEEQNNELTKSNEIKQSLLNVINTDLSKAADYVKSLLPKPILNRKLGVEVNWKFEPSAKLGGDMFGYKFHDDENFIFFLFDVCGHGIGPALYSVSVFNAINNQNLIHVDFLSPVSVLRGLNKVFNMRNHNDLYFTIWYGVLNLSTLKLTYAAAGHPPAILISNTEFNKLPEADNFFIGGVPNFPFEEATCQLNSGDSLYIFSDGAYEIRKNHNEYYTPDELKEFIIANNDKKNILDLVYKHIQLINYDPILEDDFSILKISI